MNFAVSGTATPGSTPGSDYQSLGTSAVIAGGASSVNIPVTVIDDNAIEGTESVIVTLSNNPSYTVGSSNQATVLITDNEVPAGPAVSASPNPVNRNSFLTVNWSGVAATVRDWIALYPVGGTAGSYRSWVYTSSCSTTAGGTARAAGSCGLLVPVGTPVGVYEVRILANDGFNAIATSAPLTVQ